MKFETILITGGTGSFGNQITYHLLNHTDTKKIIIYSRDEFKQYKMALKYKHNPRLKFMLGDVRDEKRLVEAMHDVDLVYHAAALKQVPACEDNPFEAVQTNVIGAKNVSNAAIRAGVKRVVAISTDKAVKPVNAMGMSKAIQEKIMLDANNIGKTTFNVVRYGNVVGSRGSVVPLFKDSITAGEPLPITQADMTRFWLSLQDAIDLVMFAAEYSHGGRILVKKAPACNIGQLAKIVAKSVGKENYPVKHVGLRKGEKVHEVLVAENEMVVAKDEGDYYVVDPTQKMPVGHQGKEYTSENTHQLTDSELEKVLAKALEMTSEAYYYNL